MLRSSFVRSVGVLVGGTAFAHAITALAMPALSRLYSPAHFSAAAVFWSMLSIAAVAGCLRFDIAVPIPEHDTDAINILGLALCCAVVFSALLAIPILLLPDQIAAWLNQPTLQPFLWLLPVGVLLAASYSALQAWLVRKKNFKQIAYSRIAQATAAAATQIGLGLAAIAPFGLLLGYVMNGGAACVALGFRLIRHERDVLHRISWAGMRAMAIKHHRFPKYSTLEALGNSAAIHLPIVVIAAAAVGPEAGYLAMAIYVMQAPFALIGNAMGQVYLSRAPAEHRAGRLAAFTVNTMAGLLKTGGGPLIFIGIVAPYAFGIIFGTEWTRAGQLAMWMTPWFLLQFLATPVSMALHVADKQRVALILQTTGLIFRVGLVYGAAVFANHYVSEAYALSGFIFYLTYVAVVLHVVGARRFEFISMFRRGIPLTLLWAAGGSGVAVALQTLIVPFKQ